MESKADRDLLADAGRLVDRHAMVWVRRINAPIARVWQTVSTKEGLERWWIVPPTAFELRAGWDGMVDKLEHVVDGREAGHSYEELTQFYVGYLRDMYRWNGMVQRRSGDRASQ